MKKRTGTIYYINKDDDNVLLAITSFHNEVDFHIKITIKANTLQAETVEPQNLENYNKTTKIEFTKRTNFVSIACNKLF